MAMYIYYNCNPKQLHVRDCVFRALSYFYDISWREAVTRIVDFNCELGQVNFTHITNITNFMSANGYERHKPPRKGMTVREFINECAQEGNIYVLNTIHPLHLTIIDEKKNVNDTWDCSDKEMKYYWFKSIK